MWRPWVWLGRIGRCGPCPEKLGSNLNRRQHSIPPMPFGQLWSFKGYWSCISAQKPKTVWIPNWNLPLLVTHALGGILLQKRSGLPIVVSKSSFDLKITKSVKFSIKMEKITSKTIFLENWNYGGQKMRGLAFHLEQTCADPAVILKNFTCLEFEILPSQDLTQFFWQMQFLAT